MCCQLVDRLLQVWHCWEAGDSFPVSVLMWPCPEITLLLGQCVYLLRWLVLTCVTMVSLLLA